MENTADILSFLTTLSSDPTIMKSVSDFLKIASSATPSQGTIPRDSPQFTASNNHIQPYPHVADGNGNQGFSPDLLNTLLSALGSGAANGGKTPCPPPESNCNEPKNPLNKLLGGKTDSENRTKLLNALRPYLNEERRSTLDVLLKLLKLAELGHLSGILNN